VTTEDDLDAIRHRLEVELAALELLDPAEVEVAASVPMCLDAGDDGVPVRWVPDPLVGWRVEGERRFGEIAIPRAHSLRRSDADFPAAAFLGLLAGVGAT